MRTTVELPDELFRRAKAQAALQGRSLKDVVADGLKLVLQSAGVPAVATAAAAPSPIRQRGSAGDWARRFVGVAKRAPGETSDDARMDHYRRKYDV